MNHYLTKGGFEKSDARPKGKYWCFPTSESREEFLRHHNVGGPNGNYPRPKHTSKKW